MQKIFNKKDTFVAMSDVHSYEVAVVSVFISEDFTYTKTGSC